jgi:hypothetical protein
VSLVYVDLEISLSPRACEVLSEILFTQLRPGFDGSANSELRTLAAELAARARNVQHFRRVEQPPATDWLG